MFTYSLNENITLLRNVSFAINKYTFAINSKFIAIFHSRYCMNQDKWLLETGVIPGLIFVIDCEGASMGHTARINIFRLRKVLQYLQVKYLNVDSIQ